MMWWLVGLAVVFVISVVMSLASCVRAVAQDITRLDDEDDEVRG